MNMKSNSLPPIQVGEKYNKLTVISEIPHEGLVTSQNPKRNLCVCDCGKELVVRRISLRSGHTMSCGCIRGERATKHGMCDSKIYGIWRAMKSRCECPNNRSAKNYKDRGIKVSERWKKFENFLEDMGEAPKGLTLERIDNNGDYSHGNCKWATYREQNMNNRRTNFITFKGITLCLTEWAEFMQISRNTLDWRLKNGWPTEKALTHNLYKT